jgi:hypothetical protein
MQQYKIYSIDSEGHISAPAMTFECAEEQEALIKLAQSVNGSAAELWSGKQLIARFPSDDEGK